MKTKALLLSALILAPSAGAAAVQSAPAQEFRVNYTKASLTTAPGIFAKSNLPQALSDEELDEVTGENPAVGYAVVGAAAGVASYYATSKAPTVGGAVTAGAVGAVTGAAGAVRGAATAVATGDGKAFGYLTEGVLIFGGGQAAGNVKP